MSSEARLMLGITLLTIPTIVFGGLTVLGVLTSGAAGIPPPTLAPLQQALYRAGHAHAGVLLILSLFMQVALDHARLGRGVVWSARVAAPLAAVLVSGGFFGLAHFPPLRVLLYGGAASLVYSTLVVGVGLLRSLRRPVRAAPSLFGLSPQPN
jgi:hypothetical protein